MADSDLGEMKRRLGTLFQEATVASADASRQTEATKLYREAADGYRHLAVRRLWEAEETQRYIDAVEAERDMFLAWCEKHCALPSIPRDVDISNDDSDWGFIARFIGESILRDAKFRPNLRRLAGIIEAEGIEFSSPGGSIQRHLGYLLADWFSCAKTSMTPKDPFFSNVAFRIAISPIMDKVVAAYANRTAGNSRGLK